jgi:TM2 domain-containing membrane protein YozV
LTTAPRPLPRPRSKAIATWLALVGGGFGLHRFYLHGARDPWAWLHPLPTLVGAYGFWRMREFGVDDARGALLVPFLGIMLAATMLQAIVYGLTSDARWAARHGEGQKPTGWPTYLAVAVALALGVSAAIATIAFTAQRYFEAQAELR